VEQPKAEQPKPVVRPKAVQGIVVEGMNNCLVKFAKCCTPVPGDEIVGFTTRGYGVSVHRVDCPNAAPERRSKADEGRWLRVSWAETTQEAYRTTLQVTGKDRMGLLVDISTVLSSTKTRVSSLNARSTPDGFALIDIETEVADHTQLQAVIRRLEQISGVMRVTRPAG
jgi:GTP pyrophosphokinase